MVHLDDYLKDVEARIRSIRESLEPLESGQMHLGTKGPYDREWRDTTAEMIHWHKQNIDMYERIAKSLRAQLGKTATN